ncbi:hypothetical protein G6F37_004016 [Rhizopus arrhizus]|nr:hypothetical protein G6F38_006521 [Rhizopus arrhizus]KAG1160403.1 hypothetical protein G6F37_004016 [Rhizopus arrhizus]
MSWPKSIFRQEVQSSVLPLVDHAPFREKNSTERNLGCPRAEDKRRASLTKPIKERCCRDKQKDGKNQARERDIGLKMTCLDRQIRMKKESFKRFKDPIVHTWFDCLQSAREVIFGRVVNKEAREYEPIKADGVYCSSMCFQLRSLVVKGGGWVVWMA